MSKIHINRRSAIPRLLAWTSVSTLVTLDAFELGSSRRRFDFGDIVPGERAGDLELQLLRKVDEVPAEWGLPNRVHESEWAPIPDRSISYDSGIALTARTDTAEIAYIEVSARREN